MQSDKEMYHALFPLVGYVEKRGQDRRLETSRGFNY